MLTRDELVWGLIETAADMSKAGEDSLVVPLVFAVGFWMVRRYSEVLRIERGA